MAITTPSDIVVTDSTHNSVSFSWTAAVDSTKTMIRYKTGDYPSSVTDGELGYHGEDTTVKITHLDANQRYYFSFFGSTDSLSVGAVTDTTTTGMVPLGIAVDNKFLYLTGATGGAIRKYNRSDLSLDSTFGPSGVTGGARVCIKGRYLAFVLGDDGYLYDMSTTTLILSFTATSDPGADDLRSVHVDDEEEYVYFGNSDGTIYYYDIATLTQNTYKPHTDNVRSIDTSGDNLISGSNDNTVALYSRNIRTSPTLIKNDFAGPTSSVEVTRFLSDYIVAGSDTSSGTVYWYNNTSPYAAVDTQTGPTDDITSVTYALGYWLVTSDDTKAYLYSGTPGALTLEDTFDEAGNDYVEDGWIDGNGKLYFIMGQGSSTEKLYTYTYLTFTNGATYSTKTALPDQRNVTLRYKSEKVIMREDFDNTGSWKNNDITVVGAEEIDSGLRINDNSYCYWSTNKKLSNLKEFTFIFEFTPNFETDEDVQRVLFYSSDYTFGMIKRANSLDNKIRLTMGGNTIRDITEATYSPAWNVGEKNTLILSAISGSTNVWLNGTLIVPADFSAWADVDIDTLNFGALSGGSVYFDGDINHVSFSHGLLTTDEVSDISNETTFSETDASNSLLYLPMDTYYLHTDSKYYTPNSGTGGDVLMGTNGVTTTTFPKLTSGGFDFDGGDQLTFATSGLDNQSKFTLGGSFKTDDISSTRYLFYQLADASNSIIIYWSSNGVIYCYVKNGATTNANCRTTEVIPTGGYHSIFVVYDGTQAVANNRVKIYIDGVLKPVIVEGTFPETTPTLSSGDLLIGIDYQYLMKYFNISTIAWTPVQIRTWHNKHTRLLK